ncbi:response regulator [Pleurocapsales cyanobacterium LEGE 10410]|nr:response regulator [Pleurocapsales cyanobacterium LEGE 10410]
MKLPATEPLCSNNIDPVLATDRRTTEPIEQQTASELALDFTGDSLNVDQLRNYLNLQPVDLQVNLSLAESISAPPKIRGFEPDLSAENLQLEDMQALNQPVWFKILVIENNDSSRDRLCQILRDENIQVIEARDSMTGIELAKRAVPDLIVCEMMMPKIDGYGIKCLLQNSQLTQKIPLLFITTPTGQTLESEIVLIAKKDRNESVNKEKFLDAIANKLVLSAQV